MNFEDNQKGFIFSLDATLAILVAMIGLAGVAQVGGSTITYRQHGYLKLERKANDALTVLSLDKTMENAVRMVEQQKYENAEELLRSKLKKILPSEIQFKLSIENTITVYPDETKNWSKIFENAEEVAVSTSLMPMSPSDNFRVLAFLDGDGDEDREEEFLNDIKEPYWTVVKTTDKSAFGDEILRKENGVYFYHTIFIPDAGTDFSDETIENLLNFSENGRILAGGETLQNNEDDNFLDKFGIGSMGTSRDISKSDEIENMFIQRPDHHVIGGSPFYLNHRVDYEGDHVYDYEKDEGTILSKWGTGPESQDLHENGIIFRDENGENPGTCVFFNMNFVQSSITENVGSSDWKLLAKRAIYWKGPLFEFRPLKLYLWREGG